MSTPQLPLTLRFPAEQRFAEFIGAPVIVPLLAALAKGERSDWILLSGPSASGKTHLLLATVAEAQVHGRRAIYLPLAHARQQLCDLLRGREDADLIAIDGLESVVGERENEIALFDFHNRARSAVSVLLYAAQQNVASLALGLPDLRSRLAQCTQLSLTALDETQRRQVLQRRAQKRGLQLDEPVLDYLFRRVSRDLASLTALLDRVDRASLAAQRRVTVPFLRELIGQQKNQ